MSESNRSASGELPKDWSAAELVKTYVEKSLFYWRRRGGFTESECRQLGVLLKGYDKIDIERALDNLGRLDMKFSPRWNLVKSELDKVKGLRLARRFGGVTYDCPVCKGTGFFEWESAREGYTCVYPCKCEAGFRANLPLGDKETRDCAFMQYRVAQEQDLNPMTVLTEQLREHRRAAQLEREAKERGFDEEHLDDAAIPTTDADDPALNVPHSEVEDVVSLGDTLKGKVA